LLLGEQQPEGKSHTTVIAAHFSHSAAASTQHLSKYLTFVIDIPFKETDPKKFLRF